MTDYGPATEQKINEVVDACERSGKSSIIALAGVPGTGKSFIASIAAQRFTDEPTLVREIQFHQSFSYEEFIEGMRIDNSGEVAVKPGVFLEWNDRASDDPDHRYILLIEELTRANLSAVLGELMTYIEHRERPFLTVYSRRPVRVVENLTIIATYNPTDRSAIEIDGALLRRLRVIDFPPSTDQLAEMLGKNGVEPKVIDQLKMIFTDCEGKFPKHYEHLMPFGHGIFADIKQQGPDLNRLWVERIRHMLRRPLMEPHMFADVIEQAYPWRDKNFVLS
jgi:5-methylcytosine-specific restriction endonuclease McrBC GTP-binding regulatory subunit McrB